MVKYYYCTDIGTNSHRSMYSKEYKHDKPISTLFGLEIEATDAQLSLSAKDEACLLTGGVTACEKEIQHKRLNKIPLNN